MKNVLQVVVMLGLSLLAWNMQAVELQLEGLAKGSFEPSEQTANGPKFTFDLGKKRMNWTHGRWSVLKFDEVKDWTAFAGVRLKVLTDKPQHVAGVYLAVRESDGSWYSHAWACDLTQTENIGFAYFTDFDLPHYHQPPGGEFKDENMRLDLNKIDALAVGVVNPLGVGEISYTVAKFELIEREPTSQAKPLEISVSGKLLDINGTSMLPAGVFGSFNLRGIPIGEPYIQVEDKRYTVKDNKIVVDGHTIEGTGDKFAVGQKQYRVTVDTTPRAPRYRLSSDKRINYGISTKPDYGDKIVNMIISNYGDRTQPSIRLADPNWKQIMENAGTSFGEAAAADGRTAYLEFWNEPYLNWANDNRINFKPRFYDLSKATEGGPVHIKFDGEVMPYLKWTKDFNAPTWNWCRFGLREWRRGQDANGGLSLDHARPYRIPPGQWKSMVESRNPPDEIKDGETYQVGKTTFTAITPWHIYDETQFTYWSGKGMLKPYLEPLIAYGTAMKKAGGDKAVLIAGWGNRPSEDHWAGFYSLYQPTIDAAHAIIDAVNDHDYGGCPIKMPASYEVVTAYGMNRYNKWLYHYNTETASAFDPQATGDGTTVGFDAGKFQWVSRKIAHALDVCPDKVRNFAHFGIGGGFWSDEGEGVAMDLMRNVRGRLVHTQDNDERIYVSASIDGSDPLNPRPDDLPSGQELVVLILNDYLEPRESKMTISAPTGTTFKDGWTLTAEIDWKTHKVNLKRTPFSATGTDVSLKETLPPRIPLVITLPLNGLVAHDAKATVYHRQYFGEAILSHVRFDTPCNNSIAIDPALLPKVKQVWLKLVVERLAHGEGLVQFNDQTLELPGTPTPENTPYVRTISLDPKALRAENKLVFKTIAPHNAGYLLGMNSLLIAYEE